MPGRRKRAGEAPKRRWRDYRSAGGKRPVKEFLDALSDADAAEIMAAMKQVQLRGLEVAQQLRGDIYEVKADGDRQTFRVLFAQEGEHEQVLLALEGFSKKQQKTPPAKIDLAQRRLRDWRTRGRRS